MRPDRRALLVASVGSWVGGAAADPAPVARFESFDYSGRDASFDTPLPAGHFRNPILSGFQPDPSLCRVGDDFYLVTSSFAYLPGLPIHHSRDLVNWRLIGHAVAQAGPLRYDGLGVSRGLFAPALSHHGGRFYLVCTMVGGGGNFVVTATNPAGPWSEPVFLPFEGIDPSIFFDQDGSAWIVNNGAPDGTPRYDGHRALWLQGFDAATLTMRGPRRVLVDGGADPSARPVWIEGPHLFRREGWLYLSAAEGGTSVAHSQVIFRSRSLDERFEPWSGNPILTQRDLDGGAEAAVTCTGHAQLVTGPDGRWWASFLGCRPAPGSGGAMWLTGRETFLLPVSWTDDGWPLVLPRGRRVPLVPLAPSGARMIATEMSGNFNWRDDFRGALKPAWLTLRGPAGALLGDGGLQLPARASRLHEPGQPAFLGRRVQHGRFEAELRLPVPTAAGVAAGLALFQSEKQHLVLSLRRGLVQLDLCDGGQPRTLAQAPCGDGQATLRLRCDGLRVQAECALGGDAPQALGPALDARLLSVQAAGGGVHFTGAVVGPCAFAA